MTEILGGGNKRFIAIAGPSGGGKSTLCRMLVERDPRFMISVSNTTRGIRPGEKEGAHYFFVTREEFQRRIEAGEMIEWAQVHGNYYGTSKQCLAEAEQGKKIVLLDIDVQGVQSFKRIFPDETLSIFILPPSYEALEQRLRSRGTDSDEIIQKRMQNARQEIACADTFDYRIVNNDLDQTYRELWAILERELGLI